jgi:hypothetical protein
MRSALFLSFFLFALGCGPATEPSSETTVTDENPPAEGFNLAGSDAQAIAIADSVMLAMGGRRDWDATRYIHWNFFGRRTLLWDKQGGRVRIEVPAEEAVYLLDINTDEGQVRIGSTVYTEPDSLRKYLDRAKSIWINDSYWLVMPFKLKDSGVTLKYLGPDTTLAGVQADVLELTFENVGRTPQNKYHVYVDPQTHLVSQWDFYSNAADAEPRFALPWQNYQEHGDILLSGDRGERKLTDIAAYTKVPDSVFESFESPDESQFE